MTFVWLLLKASGILVLLALIWYLIAPVFGSKLSEADLKERYATSSQFNGKDFANAQEIDMGFSIQAIWTLIGEYFRSREIAKPPSGLPTQEITDEVLESVQPETDFIWIGHSSFLVRMDSLNILIDPMFSEVPAPANLLGGRRFTKEIPFTLDRLDRVDVVLISHDHYDHLDYPSIKALSQKTKQFLVPLGIGAHLERWGVAKDKIQELDWWEEYRFQEIQFAFTPAQHFSGRALNDRFHTLWGSWVIAGSKERIFFSGDSGYAPHFKEIGEQFGPFDIAFMEAGQYNKLWPDVHMFPDQTYEAAKDIQAKAVMPIHWAAFSLSTHPWQEPAEQIQSNAESDTLKVIIPQIGEIVRLDSIADRVNDPWWTQIQEPK